ncbi:hypothetical protein [Oceaniferula spumae]|uniref:hypothetical protein n=1 Tax=Oceaniferula spumae TaxID=2979115 RepID=UPI003F4E6D30
MDFKLWLVRALFALALAGFSGCEQKENFPQDTGLSSEASAEGLHLSVHVASDEISSSEMLQVRVVVRSPESLKVEMPELSESSGKWGDFFVFETRKMPAELDAQGMVVQSRVYILEPDVPGEAVISALTVRGIDIRGKPVEVTSQPLTVKVTSVLTEREEKLHDIAPNERPISKDGSPRWVVPLVIITLLVIFGAVLLRLFRRRNTNVDDGRVYRDFEKLKTASADEVMKSIERAVCRLLAHQRGVTLTKVDFIGLQEAVDVPRLTYAVDSYERLQYSPHSVNESQVRALYTQFETIIDQQAKEVKS